MKRSKINAIIKDAKVFIKIHGFHLPPFAYWTVEDWKKKGGEVQDIVDKELGWDITDFGLGNYKEIGLVLFTLRNGNLEDLKKGQGKLYAEKIMLTDVGQITPMHYHMVKTEDIINRGGGKLIIQLYNPTPDGELDNTDVSVSIDGIERKVKAGETIALGPGESITLPAFCYHKFWGEEDRVLTGEVSTVNDDNIDNRFYESLVGRFPEIEEDESPVHLLVKDYVKYYKPNIE